MLALLGLIPISAAAQQFDLPETVISDPAKLATALPALAKQVLAVFKDGDRDKYLDNLFRLQIVAGQYPDALRSLLALRELRRAANPERAAWVNVQYEIYASARGQEKLPFEQAYQQSFREVFGRLDDRISAWAMRGLTMVDESWVRPALNADLEKQKGKNTIALTDALALLRDYQAVEAYHSFAPLTASLVSEDDQRRYILQENVQVKMADGATVCALIIRPRAAPTPLPALLEFTIYVDHNDNMGDARVSAAHGYAAVIGFTRGKACSPDKPVPYEHDGSDAAALIDWIAAQPWCDGRVGMYSGSYNGFTQWATAKQMPKALKAMMAGAPAAPGIDVPMEGNVFWNFIYPWPFYTTNAKVNDDATYNDSKRWNRLNHDWYAGGRAYRDLDKIDGTPNPVFDRWLAHPDYDAYWQSMIPYGKEFARINIPILTTAGYYYGGPGAAVYYFSEHKKYNPRAEHYLLIGPYEHFGAQYGVVSLLGQVHNSLAGLELDEAAKIDIDVLRYNWFDYVLKGSPKPALLQEAVNYEVTGANVWRHAPTLKAMANQALRLHLSNVRSGDAYRLVEKKPESDAFITLSVNLADRTDVDRQAPGGGVSDKAIDTWNGIEFISDPFPAATEMSGLFSGQLDFATNKKDFDFEIDLYELTPKGEYVQLAPYWTRASYIGDSVHRRLLTPGKRQSVSFESRRLMSRRLQPGSRLVAVLSIIKDPGRQINYGTGKDVSDETIQDAGVPLEIKWYGDSYLDLPVRK